MSYNRVETYQDDVWVFVKDLRSIKEISAKMKAYRELFGSCALYVFGDVVDEKSDFAFLRYSGEPVVKVGKKFLTVQLEYEGSFAFDPSKQKYGVTYVFRKGRIGR